ncbi:hypothetical protein Tco_0457988 [Tanacetum coccineum]
MADENVPALAPIRSDDQILPFAAWVPIEKSNHNTLTYVDKAGTYRFQLDEDWFTLDANLLREALKITPIDQAHPFMSPPLGDAIMDFVNEMGYPEVIHFVSSMAVNRLYQPLRAILSMINQCLTGKTFGHDRPRYPVLQMLWGIITNTNVDYAELVWEEFVQAMQTFLTHKANLVSLFHLAEEDLRLGNLKFISKGKIDEVFGMPIPNELISNNIRNVSYYNAYLEMVAKHDQKVAAKKEGKKKSASTKQPKPKPVIEKSSKQAPAPKPKLVDESNKEPAHSEPIPVHEQEGACEEYDMERAIQMSLESFQAQGHAHVGGVTIQEPVAEAIRPLPIVEGKGKAIVNEEQAAQQTPATEEATTGPSAQPQDDTSANIVRDSPSLADAETGVGSDKTSSGGDTEILQITEELGKDVEKQVLMDEDQARPDLGISSVALAGPDPKPTHDEFMTDLYPKVQESLKFPADEHVLLEDPLSLTGILSSMKNLEDAYAIGDQFINDKSTNDELGKLNVEAKVVSMVTVPIYQASSSVPPLSTLLAERVAALEKKLLDLEKTNKNLNNTTRNLESRVYTLELRDLPHKINEAVRENVKEAVQIALQAPLRDRFRDLPE